jgi:hypothetical protein
MPESMSLAPNPFPNNDFMISSSQGHNFKLNRRPFCPSDSAVGEFQMGVIWLGGPAQASFSSKLFASMNIQIVNFVTNEDPSGDWEQSL